MRKMIIACATAGALSIALLSGCAGTYTGDAQQPAAAPTPSLSATSKAAPSSTPQPVAKLKPKPRFRATTADFEHFRVTLLGTSIKDDAYMVRARNCVQKLPPGASYGMTEITSSPWTVKGGSGKIYKPFVSYDQGSYPKDGYYQKGECAAGTLTFFVSAKDRKGDLQIIYHNSLGNRARWNTGMPDKGPRIW